MKVNIGKYTTWVGAYQLADLLKYVGVSEDTCHKIGEKLSKTFVQKVCVWIESKKRRKVKVVIHDYDVWSMDVTLAYIILPMLIKLKEQKHGAPFTEDSDVPEYLRSTAAPPKENDYDTDKFHFERWDWIMDELIWTFTQIHSDSEWEDQYHTGNIDIAWKKCEGKEDLCEMIKGPLDTHSFDKEGYDKHQARITNGLRLFGHYYQALWD